MQQGHVQKVGKERVLVSQDNTLLNRCRRFFNPVFSAFGGDRFYNDAAITSELVVIGQKTPESLRKEHGFKVLQSRAENRWKEMEKLNLSQSNDADILFDTGHKIDALKAVQAFRGEETDFTQIDLGTAYFNHAKVERFVRCPNRELRQLFANDIQRQDDLGKTAVHKYGEKTLKVLIKGDSEEIQKAFSQAMQVRDNREKVPALSSRAISLIGRQSSLDHLGTFKTAMKGANYQIDSFQTGDLLFIERIGSHPALRSERNTLANRIRKLFSFSRIYNEDAIDRELLKIGQEIEDPAIKDSEGYKSLVAYTEKRWEKIKKQPFSYQKPALLPEELERKKQALNAYKAFHLESNEKIEARSLPRGLLQEITPEINANAAIEEAFNEIRTYMPFD